MKILQEKLSETEHVALTSDLWTSKANEPVITITSHFVDKTNKLHGYLLDTIGFDQEHAGYNLSSYFNAAAVKWGIDQLSANIDLTLSRKENYYYLLLET